MSWFALRLGLGNTAVIAVLALAPLLAAADCVRSRTCWQARDHALDAVQQSSSWPRLSDAIASRREDDQATLRPLSSPTPPTQIVEGPKRLSLWQVGSWQVGS